MNDSLFITEQISDNAISEFIHQLSKENLDFVFYLEAKAKKNVFFSKDITQALQARYKMENGKQLLLFHEIIKITAAFKNIPIVFIKGAALRYWLEVPLYKRSNDIDLLIQKKDIKEAVEIFESLGFKAIPARSYGEFSMKNELGVCLDVHYDLAVSSPFMYLSGIDISKLIMNYTTIINVNDSNIRTFDKEITFVHLCIHFSVNHHFNDFILLYELKKLIYKYQDDLNWNEIYNYAEKYQLTLLIETNLLILEKMSPGIIKNEFVLKRIHNSRFKIRSSRFIQKHKIVENLFNNTDNKINHGDIALFCTDSFFKIYFLLKGYIRRVIKQTS